MFIAVVDDDMTSTSPSRTKAPSGTLTTLAASNAITKPKSLISTIPQIKILVSQGILVVITPGLACCWTFMGSSLTPVFVGFNYLHQGLCSTLIARVSIPWSVI